MYGVEIGEILKSNPEAVKLLALAVAICSIFCVLALLYRFLKTGKLKLRYQRKDGKKKSEKTFSITTR
jgi:hypothetical protein